MVCPVKWFHGSMQGAPSIGSTTPGSLVAALDACLVNGFNSLTLETLSVTSEVATATRSGGHGYLLNQVILISGATPAGLNGEWRITSIPTANTFTFACPGVADGAASGTITVKAAPAGWTKAFSATNKAVYRSPNVLSPRSYFRFDDTSNSAYSCIVRAYTAMSDIDTGQNQWDAGTANASAWHKPSSGANWQIIADDRTAWFLVTILNQVYAINHATIFGLGDYTPINPSDTDNEFVQLGTPTGLFGNRCNITTTTVPDAYARFSLRKNEYGAYSGQGYGYRQINDTSGYGGPNFPSSVDGGMMLSNAWIREYGNGAHLRGAARGMYWVLANQPFSIANLPIGIDFSGVTGLEGRILHCYGATICQGSTTYYQGRVVFDKNGPW